jgi:uncharacterized protein with ParB-like and HNH nuclease domain
MPEPELKQESVKIRQIVDRFSRGELSVPEFQRAYVWRPSKAAKLLDSLYRQYPISCLVAWESSSKVEPRDRQRFRSGTLRWILDGQQRIRTLQKTRDGDLEIVFHIDKQEFKRENAATRMDGRWIRIADIWNDDTYRELRSTKTSSQEKYLDKVRQILDYEVPLRHTTVRNLSFLPL